MKKLFAIAALAVAMFTAPLNANADSDVVSYKERHVGKIWIITQKYADGSTHTFWVVGDDNIGYRIIKSN